MDGYGDMDAFNRVMLQIEAGHLALHAMPEPDAESDTLLAALNERDLLMIGLALPVLQMTWPCLGAMSEEFQHRLMALVRVQRPEWTNPPTTGDAGEGRLD